MIFGGSFKKSAVFHYVAKIFNAAMPLVKSLSTFRVR